MKNSNKIAVDWSAGSVTTSYAQARYRVPYVATVVANFINNLIANGFATSKQIVIVGHSFGEYFQRVKQKKY